MPKFMVEYYMTSTQTEEVEAASEQEASDQVIADLAYQHSLMDRPTDMVFGVRSVEPADEEPDETDEDTN